MKAKSTRGASTRQRILETAAKLVYKNGVNGTSVDDVLSASGTGKSQFYHYFASKDALVKELIEFHRAVMPAAQETLLSNLSSLAGIDAWLDQILADYDRGLYADGCPIGNLANELASQNEELRRDLQATFATWETCLSQGLRALQTKGHLRRDIVPEELATFCVAAIEGAMLLAKTEKSPKPLASTISQIRGLLKASALGASKRPQPKPLGSFSFCP